MIPCLTTSFNVKRSAFSKDVSNEITLYDSASIKISRFEKMSHHLILYRIVIPLASSRYDYNGKSYSVFNNSYAIIFPSSWYVIAPNYDPLTT